MGWLDRLLFGHTVTCYKNPVQMLLLPRSIVFNCYAGPEPAILDWYGHCVRLSVNKVGVNFLTF